MTTAAEPGRTAAFTRTSAIAQRARSLLWQSRGRAWPCWMAWFGFNALLEGVVAFDDRARIIPALIGVKLVAAVGVALFVPMTYRALLQPERLWRFDRDCLRAATPIALLFGASVCIEVLEAALVPARGPAPVSALLASLLAIPALAFILWPAGAALGDERFTARVALRLLGRSWWASYWALAWMMLLIVVPPFVLLMLLTQADPKLQLFGFTIVATANLIAWFSVFAAIYQLWRKGRASDGDELSKPIP